MRRVVNHKIFAGIVLAGALIITGCSSQLSGLRHENQATVDETPPGLDSIVVARADSIARQFLPADHLRNDAATLLETSHIYFAAGDSLRMFWLAIAHPTETVAAADTQQFERHYRAAYRMIKHDQRLVNVRRFGIPDDTEQLITRLYESAQNAVEQAIRKNPFELNLRLHIIQIYLAMARLRDNTDDYEKAIAEINQVIRMNRGIPDIYIILGECYGALDEWEKSFNAYKEAHRLVKETAFFRADTASDTTRLIFLMQQQAHARAKMYDDSTALTFLNQAKHATHSNQKRVELDHYIQWINWDDGNIRAVEERDAIYELYQQGEYKDASKRYKKLLKSLRTQRTRNLINWKIALIDFSILNRKKDGVQRMFGVVNNLPNEADSMSTIYLNDYGAMCYSLGMDFAKQKEYKLAYTYFLQAADIAWNGQGKSAVELAKLSVVNPSLTIAHCQQALRFENELDKDARQHVYRLLMNAYKSNGEFTLARSYYQRLQP
ncbi:hypothetical protein JW960_09750 [candidate division KSB1 bacterium]|nr:hypothetical protein [candidate division KSB1 bacterium]